MVEAKRKQNDDHILVERLIAKDEKAWKLIVESVARPYFRANSGGWREMCARYGVSEDAVVSRLYHLLSRDDCKRLKSFRFDCAFTSWIWWQLRDAAQGAIREVVRDREKPGTDSSALALAPDTRTPSPGEVLASHETATALNAALASLWNEKPLGAIVFLLRGEIGMPSKKVAALVGRKPAAIDQIYHRAQVAMRMSPGGMQACAAAGLHRKDALGMTAESGRLAFESAPGTKEDSRWLIEIVLPPVGTEPIIDAPLLETRLYRPALSDGEFGICGVRVAIRKGRGLLPWKDFIASIANGGVAFEPSGLAPIKGMPVFASLVEMQ